MAGMYRSLSMYPSSADRDEVDRVIRGTTEAFQAAPGFRSATVSVDALMGPGAKSGEFARIVMVDFDTLDDVMNALHAESLEELREASEATGATHLLFECREA